jgi:hypothetical protein
VVAAVVAVVRCPVAAVPALPHQVAVLEAASEQVGGHLALPALAVARVPVAVQEVAVEAVVVVVVVVVVVLVVE